MTADEVLQTLAVTIGDDWDRPTSHAVDLRAALLRPPQLVTAVVPKSTGEESRQIWLVVREGSDDNPGYYVFLDPEDNEYGLAVRRDDGRYVHIGTYGGFWDAMDSL